MTYARWVRDNPVVVMDVVKYVLAALILFGLPIPPGLDALAAGAVLAVLTVVTRSQVTPAKKAEAAIADALVTPAPGPEATGEAAYLAELDKTQVIRPPVA